MRHVANNHELAVSNPGLQILPVDLFCLVTGMVTCAGNEYEVILLKQLEFFRGVLVQRVDSAELAEQVDSGPGYQGGQLGDEIHWLEDDVSRAITIRGFQLRTAQNTG